MAEITDIKPQVKDGRRCSIYLDGRFFCGLLKETAIKNKLKVGLTVEPQGLEAIQLESEKDTALQKAMDYISRYMRTKKQLTDYLKKKGYTQAVCDYVLQKMEEYRFVDDVAYSEGYISSKSKSKGKRLLALELKQKGVSNEDLDSAFESYGDESGAATEVVKKYMRGKELTRENLSKAFRYLMSKGFEYEAASSALKALGADEEIE